MNKKRKIPVIKILVISVLVLGIGLLAFSVITNKSFIDTYLIHRTTSTKVVKSVPIPMSALKSAPNLMYNVPEKSINIESSLDKGISLIERLTTLMATLVPTIYLVMDHKKKKRAKS